MFRKSTERIVEKDRQNLLSHFPPNSKYAESYRTMRTNLFFSDMENEIKCVMLTSSVEKEGKTTTAVNLAHAVAQADRKVLLMDCDLRRHHLTSLLVTGKYEMGITELVAEVFGYRLTSGSLNSFTVDDMIQLTKLQKRTGCLDLKNDEHRIAIYFEKGRMTDMYWKNRPESKKLANTLIQNNLLTAKEANLALGHQKKSVQRLGTVLYTLGFVSKKDLAKALSVHTIEAIKALSTMTHGAFEFSAKGEDKTAISQKSDFEKLYAEFSPGENSLQYFNAAIDNSICKTETENVYLLPSGRVPSNPSELLASARMHFLLENLKTKFDFIIIDTPPVVPTSDALVLGPWTDGIIFVIRSGHAHRKIIQTVINQFNSGKLPVIGAVLNQVDMKKEGYYRYYQKYYSSYYGK